MYPGIFIFGAIAASAALGAALPHSVSLEDEEPLTPATPVFLYETISTDGTCGGGTGFTCLNSIYGNCCSKHGFCGSSEDFCAAENCFFLAGLCAQEVDDEEIGPGEVIMENDIAYHLPWKPTGNPPPKFKPSYVIDNGERAPNQVWN